MTTQSTSPHATSTAPPPNSGYGLGRWGSAVAVLVLLTEQTALGFALIAPALAGFAAEFQTTQIIWVITMFTLVGGVSTPIIGKLGDRYGKRKILLYAVAISLAGSVICALAPSFGVLLLGRALMGVSSAFLPVTFALMRDVFPAQYRDMSISIATNGVGVVTIAGPFLAGFLIDNVSLSSVFWFVAVISLIGGLGTIALVPESPVRNTSPIDLVGAIGLTAAMLLLMYGISQLQTWTFTDPRTAATVGGSVILLGAWWWWERRTADPFIDTRLLVSRPIATVVFSYGFAGGAITVMASYLPTMLQTPRELGIDYGFGLTATGVAEYLVPAGVLTVVSGVIVGSMAKRVGFRVFLILGGLLVAASATGIGLFRTDPWMPIVFYSLCGLGGMIYAAGPNLLMALSPATARGVTAAMMASIGAVLGSLFAQLGGLLLNRNVSQVVEGYPIYTGRGMAMVFLLAAAMAVVAALIATRIPQVDAPSAEPTLH